MVQTRPQTSLATRKVVEGDTGLILWMEYIRSYLRLRPPMELSLCLTGLTMVPSGRAQLISGLGRPDATQSTFKSPPYITS